ncbi:alpha-hydroxy acid oxidase [Pseudorhodoplanes sp.]|uniref:alpha-hydroxy acid oxidase n=1 Tax=Pseudorhodoplanes sp. TaxID=1934341 RepID=UPI002C97F901|nr:alpha-hydroxy acid oxidase [Pseudorhodoplanes sp.]HWV53031.1 alpha-hydroxy acid oxidase [Pseudorhodoplanes sp.]
MSSIDQVLALEDLEPLARRILPNGIFSFISGGAETNSAMNGNRAAFQSFDLVPEVLVDTSKRTTEVSLFGEQWRAPFGIAPMGGAGLAGFRADCALAKAAREERVPFILSGSSLVRLEEIARINPDAWFQAYLSVDRDEIGALIDRVSAAAFRTLVITADVSVSGNRENLIRAGFTTPMRPTVRLALEVARRPRWLFKTAMRTYLQHGMPRYENASAAGGAPVFSATATRAHVRDALSWADFEWIRKKWTGRLIVKGILSPSDAAKAREIGADAVIASNHGGRQLDCAISPLHALPQIVEAARDMPVLYDSGIRRGTDVIKAMSQGAKMVFIGRPFLYAAALGEEQGVRHAIKLLHAELHRNMALLGSNNLYDLHKRVRRRT